MREELSTALSACGVVGFIVFGIATFGMLETDSVDMPHIGLLALVMLADAPGYRVLGIGPWRIVIAHDYTNEPKEK